MFNQYFPTKSPYIRIVKTDQNMKVNEFYNSCKSPNDINSYVVNTKLNHISTWVIGKDCVNYFIYIKK